MSNKRSFKAVIFDMDGVLIDSMPYHFFAWYEALRHYGARVTSFDIFEKEGEQWEKSLKFFMRRAGKKPTRELAAEVFALRQKIFKRIFRCHMFAGAAELVTALKQNGYMLGLVTGTPRAQVQKMLPARLFRLFDAVVTGDSVTRGKPHPAPYQQAARLLGVRPRECCVLENAPYGIRSATAAGMYCTAVTTSLPRHYLKGADRYIDDIRKLYRVLA